MPAATFFVIVSNHLPWDFSKWMADIRHRIRRPNAKVIPILDTKIVLFHYKRLNCSLDPIINALSFLFVPWYIAAAVGPIVYVLVGVYLLLGKYFKFAKILKSIVSLKVAVLHAVHHEMQAKREQQANTHYSKVFFFL